MNFEGGSEIDLRRVRWRTMLSLYSQQLQADLKDLSPDRISDELLKSLSEKSAKHIALSFKLSLVYICLMLALFVQSYGVEIKFTIIGIEIGNEGMPKEALFLLATAINLGSGYLSFIGDHKKRILKALINVRFPGKVENHYASAYHDDDDFSGYFRATQGLLVTKPSAIILLLPVLWLAIALPLYFLTQVYIYIVVLSDLLIDPSLPANVHWILLTAALFFSVIYWQIMLLKLQPIFYRNPKYFESLNRLRVEDNDRYIKEMRRTLALERRQSSMLVVFLSAATYTLLTVTIRGWDQFTSTGFLLSLLILTALCAALMTESLVRFERKKYRQFFEDYPSESAERISKFDTLQKAIWREKVMRTVLVTSMGFFGPDILKWILTWFPMLWRSIGSV